MRERHKPASCKHWNAVRRAIPCCSGCCWGLLTWLSLPYTKPSQKPVSWTQTWNSRLCSAESMQSARDAVPTADSMQKEPGGKPEGSGEAPCSGLCLKLLQAEQGDCCGDGCESELRPQESSSPACRERPITAWAVNADRPWTPLCSQRAARSCQAAAQPAWGAGSAPVGTTWGELSAWRAAHCEQMVRQTAGEQVTRKGCPEVQARGNIPWMRPHLFCPIPAQQAWLDGEPVSFHQWGRWEVERGLIVHMLPTSTMALDEDGRTVGQRSPSLVSLQAMLMQGRARCYEHLTNQEHSQPFPQQYPQSWLLALRRKGEPQADVQTLSKAAVFAKHPKHFQESECILHCQSNCSSNEIWSKPFLLNNGTTSF